MNSTVLVLSFRALVELRKLRWQAAGRGKRGGYRVIYYVKRLDGVIWMLTIYPKNIIEDIPAHILRQIREEIANG